MWGTILIIPELGFKIESIIDRSIIYDKLTKEMNKAEFSAKESSKDPSSKVGARILRLDYVLESEGYNGFVKGCDEDVMSYETPLKYELTLHAEENAFIFARKTSLHNCMLITTHLPCPRCLRMALQYGVRHIFFRHTDHVDRWNPQEKQAFKLLLQSFGEYSTDNYVRTNIHIDRIP